MRNFIQIVTMICLGLALAGCGTFEANIVVHNNNDPSTQTPTNPVTFTPTPTSSTTITSNPTPTPSTTITSSPTPTPSVFSWNIETVDRRIRLESAMVLDDKGFPHLAYEVEGPDFQVYLKYAFWNGTQWEFQRIGEMELGGGVGIALDEAGFPSFTYNSCNPFSCPSYYAEWRDGEWFSIESMKAGPLVIDAQGTPHLSYRKDPNDRDDYKSSIEYVSLEGDQWTSSTVEEDLDKVTHPSLQLDSLGQPHIAYLVSEGLKYATWSGNAWEIQEVAPLAMSDSAVLMLDSADRPHIIYYDWSTNELQHAKLSYTNWQIQTVASEFWEAGSYYSIALDSHDNPHIAYCSDSSQTINYAYQIDNAWHIEQIETGSCAAISLGLDKNDQPRLAYSLYDGNEDGLRLAWGSRNLSTILANEASIGTETVQTTESITPKQTLPPQSTNTPTLQGAEQQPPLYFLGKQSIWLLKPGDTVVERITPDYWEIESFDIWPGDSRIAYGTSDGQLYVMMPNQEPRLLHDVSENTSAFTPAVGSVSWSADGTHLAYTVYYQDFSETDYPSYPSGLWLLDIEDTTPTWLLGNRYLTQEDILAGDFNRRSFSSPVWSPDGTALILSVSYFETTDILLMDPIVPDLDKENLHEIDTDYWWGHGSWLDDSQSMLLSSMPDTTYGDLIQVDRASLESKQLINGEIESMWISDAQELTSGIVFLGDKIDYENFGDILLPTRLYLGHLNEEGFSYSVTGPEHLCDSDTDFIDHIEWDSTGQWGTFACSGNEVHIVTLDGKNTNITSYISPLTDVEHLEMQWEK